MKSLTGTFYGSKMRCTSKNKIPKTHMPKTSENSARHFSFFQGAKRPELTDVDDVMGGLKRIIDFKLRLKMIKKNGTFRIFHFRVRF